MASSDPDVIADFLPNCVFAVSDDVPTARISAVGGRIRIEFGAKFLDEELSDDRDFMFVLLHEIYHHVLGHLRHSRGDRVSRIYRDLSNIAADMLVNRAVCDRFFPGGVPLLGRMYSWDSLPGALLRPLDRYCHDQLSGPERYRLRQGFETGLEKLGIPRQLAWMPDRLYELAWVRAAPYETVLEQLMDLFAFRFHQGMPQIVLIGNHDGAPDELEELGDIFSGFKVNAGGFGLETENTMYQVRCAAVNQGVAAALKRALEEQKNRWRMYDPIACPGVVCVPGRRDAAFLASAVYPVFYHAHKIEFPPEELAHVYVDVSGSMEDDMPVMFGILAASRGMIADPIHEFSNVIQDVTLAEFHQGICRTTGGTDFTVILKHALGKDYRQIVVFTDGFAELDDAVGARFVARKIKLHVVFVNSVPEFRSRCPLVPIATSIFVMS